MEMGVKWVYQSVQGPAGVKIEAGQKPSLCFKGREYMLCVAAAHPVRVFKRPVRDFITLRTVTCGDGSLYSPKRAAEKLQEVAARCGITVGAQKLLQRALGDQVEVDESQFNDEELLIMETVKSEEAQTTEGGEQAAPATEGTAPAVAKPKRTRKAKAPAAAAAPAETKDEPKAAKGNAAKSEPKPKPAKGKVDSAAKSAKAPKKEKGPSRISQAVEWMRAEVKKLGGQAKLERGQLKEMYSKGATKFGLSTITMSIQYGKQIKNR